MFSIEGWSFLFMQEERLLILTGIPSGLKTHRIIQGTPLSLSFAKQLAADTIRKMSLNPRGYQLPEKVRDCI